MTVARIREQCARMRQMLAAGDERVCATTPDVSAWSTAEHLDHSLKVCRAMLSHLAKPEAARLPKGINLLGRLILTVGRIPRGKGRAPEKLHGARATCAELTERIAEVEALLARLDAAALADSRGPLIVHPRFGGLTPMQALRFLAIHNEHHFRIARDIGRK